MGASINDIKQLERSLAPCLKCGKAAHIKEDASNYRMEKDFKICCNTERKCKTAIQTINDWASMPQDRYASLIKLMQVWDSENRMKLEWFPERKIPSSAELKIWDSRNSLRP